MHKFTKSVQSRLRTMAVAATLAIALITAAFADGPGGLGKILPPSQGTLQSDGSVLYSNGVRLLSDKRVAWGDANSTIWVPVHQSNGSWLYQDGTILYPDGTVTYPAPP